MAQSESSRIGVRRQRSSDRNPDPDHSNDNHPPPIDNDENDDEYLVSCRCESAKAISTLLSCLRNVAVGNGSQTRGGGGNQTSLISSTQNATSYSVRSSRRSHTNASSSSSSSLQPVTVYCSATNMTFHICSTSKQIQASVDMPCNLFSDYSVATTTTTTDQNDDQAPHHGPSRVGGEFCINLVTLLECLHCLGTQNLDTTKLCFSYNTTQEVFQLELLEELSGILSTASIPGMLAPGYDDDDEDCVDDGENGKNNNHSNGPRLYSLANAFRQSEKYLRIIIQSESLHELITELDYIVGATMAHVTFENGEFRIGVIGYLGECQVVLPTRGSHIISMEAPDANSNVAAQPTWTYPLHAFMESMRGLEIADETCITINLAGMMAIQHQVIQQDQTTHATPSFVDFILCCMVDDKEDEQEDPTMDNGGPVPVPRGNAVITSRPTVSRRARIVSQTKQSHENHNRGTSDSDDDDDDNEETTTSSKSHITPTSVSGARLFGSLAMDDDDDESVKVRVQVAISSKGPEVKEGRLVRRRPRTVSSPVRPDPKKSRSLKHHPVAAEIATTRAKTRGHKNTKATKPSRWKPDDDDEEEESGNSDDDREVALALSGLASSTVSSRHQRRHRRMIHDDEDDENDGSSSPELVYGQQH